MLEAGKQAIDSNGATHEQYMSLLPQVLEEWQRRVMADVPSATKLDWSMLVDVFPMIFRHLIQEVVEGCVLPDSSTTLGNAHGRERALMTDFQPCDVIHEIQLFRDVIIHCAEHAGTVLSPKQLLGIRCTSDAIMRDSLQGYSRVYRRAQDQFNSAVSRDLKNLFNVVSVTGQMVQQKATDPSISSMAKKIVDKVGEADGLLRSAIDPAAIKRNLKLRMTVTQVDLIPLIANVAVEFENSSQRIRIVGDPVLGHWSWGAMEDAIRRLIVFSKQFGSAEGDIVVSVVVEFERLILAVHNDSSFMPELEMPEALEASHDYNTHLADADGFFQVQQIAEAHGGCLIVQMGSTAGTTLTLNIPLDARQYVES